nr:PREDICTED: uncharacterized protein LOC105671868 [Linepithema humile]
MEWSEKEIVKLIECYKEEPVLWNVKLTDYRNKNKKNNAWNNISVKLKIDKMEIERKMKVLLAEYRREKQKTDKKLKAGIGTNEVYSTSWFGYKYLSFLSDKNKVKSTTDSIGNKNDNPSAKKKDKEEEEEIVVESKLEKNVTAEEVITNSSETCFPVDITSSVTPKKFCSPKSIQYKRKKPEEDPRVTEAYNLMKNIT